jgi:MFS transporter, AAHS family, 4-hydroxybenzoate transporter
MLVAMLDGWDTQSIGIVAPRLAGELALNDTQLGATFSSAQLGAAIGALLFGWLADRFGRRPLMASAAAAAQAASLLALNASQERLGRLASEPPPGTGTV